MALDPDVFWVPFTADDTVEIGKRIRGTGTLLLLASGGFGGGTLTPGYYDDGGTFRPFASATPLTAAGELEVTVGTNLRLGLDLAGATTPTLNVGVICESFQPDANL